MWTRYCSKISCAVCFLVAFLFIIYCSSEHTDSTANARNLEQETKTFQDAGCCLPELHFGFDYATAGQGKQVYDDSGNDNNGVLVDQSRTVTTFDAPCKQHVNITSGHVQFMSARLANAIDSITIAVWVRPQSVSGNQPILIVKGETAEFRFELLANGHVHWLYFAKRKTLATFGMISKTTVVVNRWTHLTVQYDAHNGRASLFIDGVEQEWSKTNGGSLELAWGKFTAIGRDSFADGSHVNMKGFIDELYIYFCAIPELVIQRLVQTCGLDGKCAPNGPAMYQATLRITSKNYTSELNKEYSTEYQSLSTTLKHEIEQVYLNISGKQTAKHIAFRNSSRGITAEFTLENVGYRNKSIVKDFLVGKLSSGSLGPLLVELDGGKGVFSARDDESLCDVSEFQCENKKCIRQTWTCDGEDDCGDWSDEIGCGAFCDPKELNSTSQEGCVACFCIGRSQKCQSGNFYRDRLKVEFKNASSGTVIHLVDINGTDVPGVHYTTDRWNAEAVGLNVSEAEYYWKLPKLFLGNRLSSYGGKLRYTLKYDNGHTPRNHNPAKRKRLIRSLKDIINYKDEATKTLNEVEEFYVDGSGVEPYLLDPDYDQTTGDTSNRLQDPPKTFIEVEESYGRVEGSGVESFLLDPTHDQTTGDTSNRLQDPPFTEMPGTRWKVTVQPTWVGTTDDSQTVNPDETTTRSPTTKYDVASPKTASLFSAAASTQLTREADAPETEQSEMRVTTFAQEMISSYQQHASTNLPYSQFDIKDSTLFPEPATSPTGLSTLEDHSNAVYRDSNQESLSTVESVKPFTSTVTATDHALENTPSTTLSEVRTSGSKPISEAAFSTMNEDKRKRETNLSHGTSTAEPGDATVLPAKGTNTQDPRMFINKDWRTSPEEMTTKSTFAVNKEKVHSIDTTVTLPQTTFSQPGIEATKRPMHTTQIAVGMKSVTIVTTTASHTTPATQDSTTAHISETQSRVISEVASTTEGTPIESIPSQPGSLNPTKEATPTSIDFSLKPKVRETQSQTHSILDTSLTTTPKKKHTSSSSTIPPPVSLVPTSTGSLTPSQYDTRTVPGTPLTESPTTTSTPFETDRGGQVSTSGYVASLRDEKASEAATTASGPVCEFDHELYKPNDVFITPSCTSRCKCLDDGNLRCSPLCSELVTPCEDNETEVDTYVPVENSSCLCVEKVCTYLDDFTTVATASPTTDAPSSASAELIIEDVRLVGKDVTLLFHQELEPQVGLYRTFEVPLTETKWRLTDGARATRDTFMRVLSEVQAIFVRASYKSDGFSTTSLSIQDISLDITAQQNAGYGKALLIEQCECPAGYSGLSCEYCSLGYTWSSNGLDCVKCSCHGHADMCDPGNGTCVDCRDNTEGLYCDRCQSGYFGDASKGTPTDCHRCPCPLTMPPNQFSPTCFLDKDGLPTCDACSEGHKGRNCELCAENFTGNPMIHHSRCEPAGPRECDPRGSMDTKKDNITHNCLCKSNVQGVSCDTCQPGYFGLQGDNPQGCMTCFCNGLTDSCQTAVLNRTQIQSTFFVNDMNNFTLVTSDATPVMTSDLFVNPLTRELTFQSFVVEAVQEKILYWMLPHDYRGNKVTAYGGIMSYVISFAVSSDGQPISAPDVILLGNGIFLLYVKTATPESGEEKEYQVKFEERFWTDSSGSGILRDQLLMVLAGLEAVMIRASYNTRMLQATLREVFMDIATESPTNLSRVTAVEQCACPPGYQGLSCESCKPGYHRSRDGPFLGTCVKCDCHGHSEQACDPETGQCKACQHNTGGFRCGECLTGFYGDAIVGNTSDCKPCPCPMTSPPNRFSPTCLMAGDGLPTCDACPPGYAGRRCERCAKPYIGDPTEPGGQCELEIDCGCDVRGSVNSSCDPVTRHCFCKVCAALPLDQVLKTFCCTSARENLLVSVNHTI